MTLFSLNLVLKVAISASAALMWSLIHALQALRYILLINVRMPLLINILMEYLAVVVGELDIIETAIPDFISMFIVDSDKIHENSVLYDRFQENGRCSPLKYRL